MANLKVILTNDEGDTELQCESCDVRFTVMWHRNSIYTKIEYCPFCGEEIDEWIEEEQADEPST